MFDFDLIDDILFDASELTTSQLQTELSDQSSYELGALVEYGFLQSQPENSHWPKLDKMPTQIASSLVNALAQDNFDDFFRNLSLQPRPLEFARPPTTVAERRHNGWVTFRRRLQAAAESVGGKKFARGLTGSFDEIQTNAIEHSQNPTTALVGYGFNTGYFGLVVADAGEGVLASLKRNPTYVSLPDASEALKMALHKNVSRHQNPQRGNGLPQVLSNLEFAGCEMRFRSGNAVLAMNPEQPRVVSLATEFAGFLWHLQIVS